jgi:bifunctional UDP-N-acetylglucosamine pyrophosphorylase/glucosamine-1-phosphate N-acetyltransferase
MTDTARWLAVVMAAGAGTRMRSRLPKVAHAIAGRPIVRHVIESARAAGVDECVVVVGGGAGADAVRLAAGDGVRFAVQHELLGTGDAVARARDAAGGAEFVLILNGDVPLVLPSTLRRLMAAVDPDDAKNAAVPDLALLTAAAPVEAYGVLDITADMRITSINETKGSEGIDRTEVRYINAGQYAVRASWLWPRLDRIAPVANGERYLTALAVMAHDEGNPGIAVEAEEAAEVRGINDRVQLAEAEGAMRERIRRAHMLNGVTMRDPASTFIDAGVTIGQDTVIEANTHMVGVTSVGAECVIGPGTVIRDSEVGDRCAVRQSSIEESTLEDDIDMGPFSHLRPRTHVCAGVHIGNFAEVKGSRLGRGTKMGHFSYIGDADVGEDVNIGAGTITANYDGASKHRTVIEDGAFIGSDTMLVAPVRVGRGARTGAGSVVTKDVPGGMMAIGSPARLRRITGAGEEDDAGQ